MAFLTFSTVTSEDKKEEESIKEYVKQLGDSDFKIREKATRELIKISFKYEKLLTEELKNTNDLEIQERLKDILDQSEEKLNDIFGEKILKGQELLSEKKYTEALAIANEVIDIRPNYKKGLQFKAQVLQEKADYKECIQLLKKCLDSSPSDSIEYEETGIELSRVMLKAGEYKDAVTLLEKMSVQTRWEDNIQYLLNYAYELNNDLDKAEKALVKEEKQSNSAQKSTSLAWFYIRIGNLDKAKPLLEKALTFKNRYSISDTLNYLFLEENEAGTEKIKQTTEPIISSLMKRNNLTTNEMDSNDIFYFCYQYYFETVTQKKSTIDFKALYQLFTDDDKKVWPVPLLGLYGGVLTVEQLEAQVQNLDKYKMRMDSCEAYFYLGLLRMCEKNTKDAKKYFTLSKDQKIYEYIETTAACYFLQKIK